MTAPRTPRIPYGGDYNPEQGPEPVRDDDHRLFTQARVDTQLGQLTCEARLVFEIVLPRGAEPVGTYGTDFYAGTPAVTRNRFGEGGGEGWYVATALDQPGVDWTVRRILARHDLLGPYADHPALETATRVAPDGTRLLFLLNHAPNRPV